MTDIERIAASISESTIADVDTEMDDLAGLMTTETGQYDMYSMLKVLTNDGAGSSQIFKLLCHLTETSMSNMKLLIAQFTAGMSSMVAASAFSNITRVDANILYELTPPEPTPFESFGSYIITIDKTNIDSALADFPITLFLSTDCGQSNFNASKIFTGLGANKLKIRFTQSGVERYAEIDSWDESVKEAFIHIKIPNIASSGVETFNIEWNVNWADNTDFIGVNADDARSHDAWDSSYKGVWHMESLGGTNSIRDSTINLSLGTPSGAGPTSTITSQISKGIVFDGIDDSIKGYNVLGTSGDITIEAILTTTSVDIAKQKVMTKGFDTAYNYSFGLAFDELEFLFDTGGTQRHTSTSANLALDTYYHIAMVFDTVGNTVKMYKNGVEVYSQVETTAMSTNNTRWYFSGDAGARFDEVAGVIDEIRFSESARSAAWVKATYYTLFDDLLTVAEI